MTIRFVLLCCLVCLGLSACRSTNTIQSQTPAPTPEQIKESAMITYYKMTMDDGTELQYGVVLPNNYKEGATYPVLLALPPGPQTEEMVYFGIESYWGREAQKRGWVVISPIAPNGNLFFRESGQYISEFLNRIESIYPPAGGKFYIGGVSNGGISSFHIAIEQPDRFHKILALPGFPQQTHFTQLDQITNIPVHMFVGEQDTNWVEQMQATETELKRLGAQVYLEVATNEGHVLHSLTGKRLFDILETN